MRISALLCGLAFAGLLAACGSGRGTELNERDLVGDWSPNRSCQAADFLSFQRDGNYSAPMNATRREIGVWSFRDGVLSAGNALAGMTEFRVNRVGDDEMQLQPVAGGEAATRYRCSR